MYYGVAGAFITGSEPYCKPDTSDCDNGTLNLLVGNIPKNGMFGWKFVRALSEVKDGLSNTLAMGEFQFINVTKHPSVSEIYNTPPGLVRCWTVGGSINGNTISYQARVIAEPINAKVLYPDVPYNHLPFTSTHPGGANFLMGDGSVSFLNETLPVELLKELATVDGGEVALLP